MTYLYEKVVRVAEMRHIHPVLRVENSVMFRRINRIEDVHPRDQSFLWSADPTGDEFTFDQLNQSVVLTQHHSAVFFRPSLAEVYAWIRVYMKDDWRLVRFFWIQEFERVPGTTDVIAKCLLMGGRMLVKGDQVTFADGSIGHELVEIED